MDDNPAGISSVFSAAVRTAKAVHGMGVEAWFSKRLQVLPGRPASRALIWQGRNGAEKRFRAPTTRGSIRAGRGGTPRWRVPGRPRSRLCPGRRGGAAWAVVRQSTRKARAVARRSRMAC